MIPARHIPCTLILLAGIFLLPRFAAAQCGHSVSGRFGGETSAVAQVNANTLMVARGTEVEMFNLANPSAPAPYSPRRRAGLEAPAIKISMTQGGSKAFVLLADGRVQVLSVVGSSFLNPGAVVTIPTEFGVDIVADGTRVYIANTYENPFVSEVNHSDILEYDASSGSPQFVWQGFPLIENYGFDRLVIVGGVLWAGFHEYQSQILGVDGFNLSNPANPTRTGTALTNGPLGTYTARISAMTASGNKLLVSYRHSVSNSEDWLRAVNVSVATNPVWGPAFDLNGYGGTMSAIGNQLRISIKDSGIGTWDIANPAALSWLGGYFDQFPKIGQMTSVPGTDYWAAGPAGLMTMNTSNPAALTTRSTPIVPLPTSPTVVRQRGNITVVLDYTLNALRIFDFTLPEAQQLRSSFALPFYSELIELGELSGGAVQLACVASQGNPSGDVIAIIDYTNPAAPFTRSTISGFRTSLLSVSGSRLYAFTTGTDFKIYELSQNPAQHRSTTHYGGSTSDYTCLTSWSNNAAALGTRTFGLWLMDTTNATAPFVSAIWNPTSGYRVNSMAKSPNYLYTSATVSPNGTIITDTRLEVLVVSNITNPTQRFAVTSTTGFGYPGEFSSLTYVPGAASNFLVGVRGKAHVPGVSNDDTESNSLSIFQLASFFFVENVPTPIAAQTIPFGHGNVAVNGDGSRILVAGDAAGLYQIAMPTSWAPGFGLRPFDQRPCAGGTAILSAVAFSVPTSATFQWYRDGVAIMDGPTPWGTTISGSNTISLEFSNLHQEDGWISRFVPHVYTCIATNSCGSTTSPAARLDICYVNCDCSTAAPVLNVLDFNCFLNKFAAGDPYANCDGSTASPVLNVNDFQCFMNKYATGCPG